MVKVTEYNFHSGTIRWQISKYAKVVMLIFALALIVNEYNRLSKKIGQGQEVQFSQWHHLMANIKIYNR